jgi:segregation and condensation protein A
MTGTPGIDSDFENSAMPPFSVQDSADTLIVDLAGFEGPLDLLLALARTHRLDLKHVSMAALAGQYIAFIERAGPLRLEAAADYLVMAAWLTFLKSRLLLPKAPDDPGLSGEELAMQLAFRLQRLAAMREAAARLLARDRLGRTVFARGQPEPIRIVKSETYDVSMYDLLRAYADQRKRTVQSHHTIKRREVWSIKDARTRLERLIGALPDWADFDLLMGQYLGAAMDRKTVTAASFGAILELARDGRLDLQQAKPYATLFVRGRPHLKLVTLGET